MTNIKDRLLQQGKEEKKEHQRIQDQPQEQMTPKTSNREETPEKTRTQAARSGEDASNDAATRPTHKENWWKAERATRDLETTHARNGNKTEIPTSTETHRGKEETNTEGIQQKHQERQEATSSRKNLTEPTGHHEDTNQGKRTIRRQLQQKRRSTAEWRRTDSNPTSDQDHHAARRTR